MHPTAVRIHKNNVLLTLPGVEDMDTALHLKKKKFSPSDGRISICRKDAISMPN